MMSTKFGYSLLGLTGGLLAIAVPNVASAAWETRNVAGMSTHIYTPAAQSPIGDGRGLMVVLHGCVQSAQTLRDAGNFEPVADDLGIVIAIPGAPNGGVLAGCWDYFGGSHSRTNGHSGAVISLAQTLGADATYDIDPDQVYVTGLSSGAGMVLVLGCLAPDVFAGVAPVAGPAVGTSSFQTSTVAVNANQAAATCTQLAGGNGPAFSTQLAMILADQGDFVVAQGYGAVNAEMFGIKYAGSLGALASSPIDIAALPGASPAGTGTAYSDSEGPRIALLRTSGVGHNWPAGSGAFGGSFVTGNGVNFSYALGEAFTFGNRRATGVPTTTGGESSDGSSSSDGGESTDGGSTDGGSTDGGSTDGGGSDDAGTTEDSGQVTTAVTSLTGLTTGGELPGLPGCRTAGDPTPRWSWLALGLLGVARRRRTGSKTRA